jgi:serine/threonine protein kinase
MILKKTVIQEAKAASTLDHPNIGSIYEFEKTAENEMFLVKAHYVGKSLRDRLNQRVLNIAETVDIFKLVCLGLERPMKPASFTVILNRLSLL